MFKKIFQFFLSIFLLSASMISIQAENTQDFEKLYGAYSLEKILQSYNIFSFGDASGAHIVGPIAAKGDLYKVSRLDYDQEIVERQNQGPTFSDYHQGVSSFIQGKVYPGSVPTGTYSLNHLKEGLPDQYVGSVNTVRREGSIHYQKTLVNETTYLHNTHDPKNAQVYRSDQFIDWEKAYQVIQSQSVSLLDHYDREIKREDRIEHAGYGHAVRVEKGEKVLIPGDLIHEIDMIIYEGGLNDPLSIIHIDTEEAFVAPRIHIEAQNNDIGNNNNPGEWGKALNILWNIPFAKKIHFSNPRGHGLGHVVAPNADIYNAQGNYSGSQIAQNFYSTSEGHMWPLNVEVLLPPMPEDPKKPEEPTEPEKPTVPEENPEEPKDSEKPTVPEETPEEPKDPEKPTVPEETPEEPKDPEKPTVPEETPEEPKDSEKPTVPEETPEEPKDPEKPTVPEETPEEPKDPEKPTVPEETPEEPKDPEKPTVPEETPEEPKDPEKPTVPEETPEEPKDPEKPTVPEETPEEPKEPEKPTIPEEEVLEVNVEPIEEIEEVLEVQITPTEDVLPQTGLSRSVSFYAAILFLILGSGLLFKSKR